MLLNIGVIGSSQLSQDDKAYRIAYEVGALIAKNKAALICGGMSGVMEAASKGCAEAGGIVVGILDGIRKGEANQFVTISLPTGLRITRNSLISVCSDAIVAVSGGAGTLSEIALALKAKKPVVAIRTSGGICTKLERLDLNVIMVNSAYEAVDLAIMRASDNLRGS